MKNIFYLLIFLFAVDVMRKRFVDNLISPVVDSVTEAVNEESQNDKIENQTEISENNNEIIENNNYSLENKNSDSNLDKIYLDITYCTKTYSKQYEELRKELLGQYSQIEVRGHEYPVNPVKKVLSYLVSTLQMSLMIILIGGQFIRNYLSFIPQRVFTFLDEKKFMIMIFNFFVVGQITTFLGSTGAFEVIYNNENIWSYLDMKVLPKASDIISILSYKGVELE